MFLTTLVNSKDLGEYLQFHQNLYEVSITRRGDSNVHPQHKAFMKKYANFSLNYHQISSNTHFISSSEIGRCYAKTYNELASLNNGSLASYV